MVVTFPWRGRPEGPRCACNPNSWGNWKRIPNLNLMEDDMAKKHSIESKVVETINDQPSEIEYLDLDDNLIGYWTEGEWDPTLPYQGQLFGALRVWWLPQTPMPKSFYVKVGSVEEAVKIMRVLADYDLFQLKHKVKPDYTNAGGLEVWVEDCDGYGNPGWTDWLDEETGIDNPEEYLEYKYGSDFDN